MPIYVSARIATSKGRNPRTNALWGLFLGWRGVLIVALQRSVRADADQPTHVAQQQALYLECPHCKEAMRH